MDQGLDELDDLLADLEVRKGSTAPPPQAQSSGSTIDLGSLDSALDSLAAAPARHPSPPRRPPSPEPAPAVAVYTPPPTTATASKSGNASLTCAHCRKGVSGPYLQAGGKDWHEDCFKCVSCGSRLGNSFFDRPGGPMCERCVGRETPCSKCRQGITGEYYKMDDGKFLHPHCRSHCATCGQAINSSELQAMGNSYHQDCFRCANCNKLLSGSFIRFNNKPHCETCGAGETVVCTRCKSSVSGKYVAFEGKNYHNACFRCGKCNTQLSPSEFFRKGDLELCRNCAESS